MWSSLTIIGILLVTANQGKGGSAPAYSTDLETELRTALFTGYEVLQRPSERVSVTVSMNLITVNSLWWPDSRLQWNSNSSYENIRLLFTSEKYAWTPKVVIENRWPDPRLRWITDKTKQSVRFLFSDEKNMWTPKLVIVNSVNDLEVFSDANTLIRLNSVGAGKWTPGGVFETSCEADITYYPLDTQTCSIVLTTWSYTSNEITLSFDDDPFILDNFSENGEWELLETSNTTESAERSRSESYTYDKLYFTLKLRRRPLYHILNTIFPVILMSCLIVFVFKLPPESGERVGMSLTATYLTIILMLSNLSVIFTIVVLDIYFNHDDDEAPPDWLQKFTKYFLVNITCWKGRKVALTDDDEENAKPEERPYSWKE
ncbi:ACHB-like protein, partial [Mya arenaria]